ncbi:MAG: CHAT domain-containing protein [Rubrivivax sp.]|nr:CHAT domain-containing protein [Rubrivivax sp.]
MAEAPSSSPITFVIPGQRQTTRGGAGPAAAAGELPGRVKESVRVAVRRSGAAGGAAGGDSVRVTAVPGEDVVVLRIAGGPALVLHPENARDLLLGQGTAKRSGRAADVPGEVAVPAQLRWRGLEQAAPTRTRGFLGDVLLSAFEVITGFTKEPAANFVASRVVQHIDGQVDAGVYALVPESLPALKGSGRKLAQVPASAEPMLVLIHGTFVETVSTFGKLWTLHPQRVRELFRAYGDRVYALDHPTLGASPIANALTLVQALPKGARLHLATHSRGGLVAEVLARVAGQRQIGAADLTAFAGAGYAGQRQELQDLAAAIVAKDIRVERVVRVACPARGTLLASKRLDAYLSVLRWSLDVVGVPVVPSLVDFLAEVARRRADPSEIPGLAAMIPGAPLLDWLNDAEEPVPGELRVVAGDIQGDSVTSWIKTLLADAYYWTDNDIVVQTRSMYAGSPRAGGASFLLDRGGKVTHFAYFANERTVEAVVGALVQAQPPTGFRTIGPLSWAGQDSGGLRAARRAGDDRPASERPAVFVLPGILGSHLKAGDKRIWLSLRLIGGLSRLKYQPGGADGVAPDGPIGMIYDDLCEHLAATHEVIPFAFDWRRPIEEEAQRLADAVEQALDARAASGQPVRLMAHSMGGVVARTMQLERPKTWARLMARPGARLVMLGTPNGGSWAPMQVLSGDDTFGNTLVAFGSPLRDRQARQLMAEMPGFLQLQADLLDPTRGLDRQETWKKLAEDDLRTVQDANWWHRSAGDPQLVAYEWGVPTQEVLTRAKQLRERLDAQRDRDLAAFADRMLLVVGQAKFTPDGYEWTDEGLVYLDATDGGDGRVTLASAMLPGVRTWKLDCEHGSLPDAERAFPAFEELLVAGDTTKLERLAGATRGGGAGAGAGALARPVAHVRSRPSRAKPAATPAESTRSVFELAPAGPDAPAGPRGAALRISVVNGNLSFVRQPLLVGHYRSMMLTGTEKVVDRLVGGAMQAALGAGLYPDAPGTHQVFVNTRSDPDNPWRPPRPVAAVVVGLGEEGKLTEQQLVASVRQATLAWAQRVAEDPQQAGFDTELAATLLGSGGMGISPSATARAIAQGVREANERLAASGWPQVRHLTLVELYLERASDAWRGLQVLAVASPERFEVAPTIHAGTGPLRRQVDSGYRGADYDLVTATQGDDPDSISFTLDTRRARTEVRAQRTQGRLVRELVRQASTDVNDDPQIGRTLFQLLVPVEVEPFLGGTSRMLLEVDEHTAPIPWELLDTGHDGDAPSDPRPWAIRCQLLRKLQKKDYRMVVRDASADDSVLVIGEPLVDKSLYDPLPGAKAEARAVADLLGSPGGLGAGRVVELNDENDARSIVSGLLARRYRVVHIAGHGEPTTAEHAGGVVLSDDTFLSPREIETMRTVPELVFVNCCHLAARDTTRTLNKGFDRSAFAAGVADKLIEIGVRCVIAAGWAVEDGPAETFATTFYRELLRGANFITAVGAARLASWNDDPSGKTWAAYQCYGDPNWTLRQAGGDAQVVAKPFTDQYESISSPLGLTLALEELATESRFGGAESARQLEKARHLEARFAPLWGGMGAVAEAYGLAFADAGDSDGAIRWYERALLANDASASLKSHEQLGNLRVRRAWTQAKDAAPGSKPFVQGMEQITHTLRDLQALAGLQPTMERLSLVGSAWKRLSWMHRRARHRDEQQAALQMAADAYRRAEELAAAAGHPDLFYPAMNRFALQLAQHAGQSGWGGLDPEAVATVRRSLLARTESEPDFWSWNGLLELQVYEALAARQLADKRPALEAAFDDLHARVSARRWWSSVADQAGFVLGAYAEAGSAAERAAARGLLALLEGYAK